MLHILHSGVVLSYLCPDRAVLRTQSSLLSACSSLSPKWELLALNVPNPKLCIGNVTHSWWNELGWRFGAAYVRSCVWDRLLVNIFPNLLIYLLMVFLKMDKIWNRHFATTEVLKKEIFSVIWTDLRLQCEDSKGSILSRHVTCVQLHVFFHEDLHFSYLWHAHNAWGGVRSKQVTGTWYQQPSCSGMFCLWTCPGVAEKIAILSASSVQN